MYTYTHMCVYYKLLSALSAAPHRTCGPKGRYSAGRQDAVVWNRDDIAG